MTQEPKSTRRQFVKYLVGGAVVVAAAGVGGYYYLTQTSPPQPQITTTVAPPSWEKATGLNNPRGLKFGPDGYLYVAEAGLGGTTPATGDQVPPPVGPYTGGKTSRVSKIGPTAERITVADGLPSDQTSAALGGDVSGVADIDFIGASLYALNAGGGASHGNSDAPNSAVRVNADGTVTQIADLSAFLKANPVKNPQPNDFEPDGTWYNLVHIGSDLYAVEPNHGELDKITVNGQVSRVVDISDSQGHIVPTSVAVGPDGNFYVGNLTVVPYVDGSAKILKITTSGDLSVFATGLTTVVGVAFDSQGRLYALETSTGNTPQPPFMVPGSGKVVRLSSSGSLETVVSGLMFPTSMTFGPDGKIYISNKGFGFKEGEGEIVAATVT